MKTQWTVEFTNSQGEIDYIEPFFEGEPHWDNDSFDYAGTHCTGGRSGTRVLPSYVSMADSPDITWDKNLHTEEENLVIEQWLKIDENREELQDRFCNEFEKEQNESNS